MRKPVPVRKSLSRSRRSDLGLGRVRSLPCASRSAAAVGVGVGRGRSARRESSPVQACLSSNVPCAWSAARPASHQHEGHQRRRGCRAVVEHVGQLDPVRDASGSAAATIAISRACNSSAVTDSGADRSRDAGVVLAAVFTPKRSRPTFTPTPWTHALRPRLMHRLRRAAVRPARRTGRSSRRPAFAP